MSLILVEIPIFHVNEEIFLIFCTVLDFAIGCCLPKDVDIDPIIIPLPHLPEKAMEAIIRWCRHHRDEPDMTRDQLTHNLYQCTGEIKDPWDLALCESLDEETLFDVLLVGLIKSQVLLM